MMTRLDPVPAGESWAAALARLRAAMPEAENFAPDQIATASERAGRPLAWRQVPAADQLGDAACFARLVELTGVEVAGVVTVVCDHCYRRGVGPFEVPAERLVAWLAEFGARHRDGVFAGDAVIIGDGAVVIFHHEGRVAVVRARELERG